MSFYSVYWDDLTFCPVFNEKLLAKVLKAVFDIESILLTDILAAQHRSGHCNIHMA